MNEIDLTAGLIVMQSEKLETFTKEKAWALAQREVAEIRESLNRWEAEYKKLKKVR